MKSKKPLILASASPRRKELLERSGISFIVDPSTYDETPLMRKHAVMEKDDRMTPYELTKILALEKAKEVSQRHPDHIVLAADTIGFLEGRVLGKANSPSMAKEMITRLSGKTHSVISGYCIMSPERTVIMRALESLVSYRKLNEREIDEYISKGEWKEKSCCYAIQGHAKELIAGYEGSLENIIGLPINEVLRDLRTMGL